MSLIFFVLLVFLLNIYTLNGNVSGNFREISYTSISKYYQFYGSLPLQIFAHPKEHATLTYLSCSPLGKVSAFNPFLQNNKFHT